MRGGEGERLFIDMMCQGRRRGRKRRTRRKEGDDQLSWDTYYLSAQHWANGCKGTNYRFISNHQTGAFCSNPIHCSILTAPSDSHTRAQSVRTSSVHGFASSKAKTRCLLALRSLCGELLRRCRLPKPIPWKMCPIFRLLKLSLRVNQNKWSQNNLSDSHSVNS